MPLPLAVKTRGWCWAGRVSTNLQPPPCPRQSSSCHYGLHRAGGKGGIPSRATQQPALVGLLRLVSEAGLETPRWGLGSRHNPTSSVTAESWIKAQQWIQIRSLQVSNGETRERKKTPGTQGSKENKGHPSAAGARALARRKEDWLWIRVWLSSIPCFRPKTHLHADALDTEGRELGFLKQAQQMEMFKRTRAAAVPCIQTLVAASRPRGSYVPSTEL